MQIRNKFIGQWPLPLLQHWKSGSGLGMRQVWILWSAAGNSDCNLLATIIIQYWSIAGKFNKNKNSYARQFWKLPTKLIRMDKIRGLFLQFLLLIWLGLAYHLANAQSMSCPLITIDDLEALPSFPSRDLLPVPLSHQEKLFPVSLWELGTSQKCVMQQGIE